MTPEKAEILALEALAWLAGRHDDITGFLAVSGLETADLRQAAGERDFLVSLLDFLLANEVLLLDFCRDASMPPQTIHKARFAMGA